MIIINEKMSEILDNVKDPTKNHYPMLYSIVLGFDMSSNTEKWKRTIDLTWLETFRSSWNEVNSQFIIGKFYFDEISCKYVAIAVKNFETNRKNWKNRVIYEITADAHDFIFTSRCSKITMESKNISDYNKTKPIVLPISSEDMSFYKSIFKEALKKAEENFGVNFPDENVINQLSNKERNIMLAIMEDRIKNAFWSVLNTTGISKFKEDEVAHIMSLYIRAMYVFPDYAQEPREKRHKIFVTAYERAVATKQSEYRSLFYEILKNNLDHKARLKGDRIWLKVGEKVGRNEPESFIYTTKNSHHKDVSNIVYVLYESRGCLESYVISDIWLTLKEV